MGLLQFMFFFAAGDLRWSTPEWVTWPVASWGCQEEASASLKIRPSKTLRYFKIWSDVKYCEIITIMWSENELAPCQGLNRIHEEINILQVLGSHPGPFPPSWTNRTRWDHMCFCRDSRAGLVSLIDVDEAMPGSIRHLLAWWVESSRMEGVEWLLSNVFYDPIGRVCDQGCFLLRRVLMNNICCPLMSMISCDIPPLWFNLDDLMAWWMWMHVKTCGILVVKLLRLRVKSSACGRIDAQRPSGNKKPNRFTSSGVAMPSTVQGFSHGCALERLWTCMNAFRAFVRRQEVVLVLIGSRCLRKKGLLQDFWCALGPRTSAGVVWRSDPQCIDTPPW